uniref:Uncharacterized protein n=1 Tax=Avena sativa TaxID=4498 RepID=A0ACD5TSK1_AVESA
MEAQSYEVNFSEIVETLEVEQPAAGNMGKNHEIGMEIELASSDTQPEPTTATPANGTSSAVEEIKTDELMLDLSKYILLLATLVATVTYAAAFSPAGVEWQDKDAVTSHLAGYAIIRGTSNLRYQVFYYCNATAFASSLVVIVLVLFLQARRRDGLVIVKPMQAVMVLDLLSAVGACAAGTCYDRVTTIYSLVLVGIAITWLVVQMAWASFWSGHFYYSDAAVEKRLRKVLMLFGTFTVGVTYVAAGKSTPGGFWDDSLVEGHGKHQTVLLCFNSTAFVTSLLIIVVLLDRKPRVNEAYGLITVALLSLTVAYIAGSCRKIDTTIYVSSLVGAVLIFIIILQIAVGQGWIQALRRLYLWNKIEKIHGWLQTKLQEATKRILRQRRNSTTDSRNAVDKASSLVLLLATLAATVTYQAGLNPPGGVWPDNGGGHIAGDPILLTTNARRFKVFFYCNSIAFMASLVTIILVQNKFLLQTHVLEAAMILDLFALIGAYAAGSCRDARTSVYTMALPGAVLFYVVIHVVFSTLNYMDTIASKEIDFVEKRRKRLLLFAVLAATITYQAGLNPPGGFRLQDDNSAGDPVLLHNFPHRYTAFFYCNSVSFMVSIVLIILLMNRHLYRLAIRSYALTICTAAGMLSLMGSYAAGSTQHLRTSIYIFVLVAVVVSVMAGLVLYTYTGRAVRSTDSQPKPENGDTLRKKRHAKRKYLMLIGILVASVTYQAGLNPPGGTWQSDSGWYLAFFYSNFTSFVASILVIVLLLPQWWSKKEWSLKTMKMLIFLDLLALQGAYAAGSSKGWKTSMYVLALIGAVLAYIVIHIALAMSCRRSHDQTDERIQEWNQEQLVAA